MHKRQRLDRTKKDGMDALAKVTVHPVRRSTYVRAGGTIAV